MTVRAIITTPTGTWLREMHGHKEIDEWLEVSLEVLDKHEMMFGPTAIDDDLIEAINAGRMTPEEAAQCRADYLSES